jgi:large conductance mechanosensitive channel
MLKEFKEFIMKGNLIDLAVGLVIGAAFGKVTEGFMSFIVNPLVGLIGGADFSQNFIVLKGNDAAKAATTIAEVQKAGGVALGYGAFISAVLNFVIVGFVMFLVLKAYNKMKREGEAAVLPPAPDVALLAEIRDILKEGK